MFFSGLFFFFSWSTYKTSIFEIASLPSNLGFKSCLGTQDLLLQGRIPLPIAVGAQDLKQVHLPARCWALSEVSPVHTKRQNVPLGTSFWDGSNIDGCGQKLFCGWITLMFYSWSFFTLRTDSRQNMYRILNYSPFPSNSELPSFS